MKLKVNFQKPKIGELFFLFIIYIRFSFMCYAINELVVDTLIVSSLVLYQILTKKKITLKLAYIEIFLLLLMFVIISCSFNLTLGKMDLRFILQLIDVLFLVSTFSKEDFCENYVGAIYIISVLILIGFSMRLLFPDFVEKFPAINWEEWHGAHTRNYYRNLFICVVDVGSNYTRNMGIFYEPGMCALFLNIALFIEMLINEKKNMLRIIIITIAGITTLSTNGLITIALIYIVFFLQTNKTREGSSEDIRLINKAKKIKRWAFAFGIVALIIVVIFFIKNPNNWVFLVSKLSEYENATEGSGFERYTAIKNSFVAFAMNPITGITISNYSLFLNGQIASFTPMQWFVFYGIFFGAICNIGFARFAIEKKYGWAINLLRIGTFFTLVVSQNTTQNIFVLAMIFYVLVEYLSARKVRC